MKTTSVAILVFAFCLLSLCSTDDAPAFKRSASSDETSSKGGTTGGASSAGSSASEVPPTNKTGTSGVAAHGGNPVTTPTSKPAHIPNGVSSVSNENRSSCGSLEDGDLSPSCLNASATVEQLLMPINGSTNIGPEVISVITSTIGTYCSSTCLGPILEYYECTENIGMTEATNGFICGEFRGQFCPIVVVNSILGGQLSEEDIASSCMPNAATSCPKDCNSTLNTINNLLGCCTPGAVQLGVVGKPELYEACAILVPEPCTASTSNTTATAAGAGLSQTAITLSLVAVFLVFATSWIL